jgi:uncharacterized membrane protein YbhN (UPF0104 family)
LHVIWHTLAASTQRLAGAKPAYALAAWLLYVVSLFIAGARWRGFLRALGGDVTTTRAALATLGGIAAGNLTPAPGGEACRIGLVRIGGRATWPQATIAAIWDRLSELPPILILVVMALAEVRSLASARRPAGAALALAAAIVIGGFALWRVVKSNPVLGEWRRRTLGHGVRAGLFSAGVGFSSLLWLQDYLRLKCVTLAFGLSLAPTQIAMLSVVAMLGGIVPAVAGLGPVEGGHVAGLLAVGVDLPTAAAVTALERVISYGFSTAAGGVVIALLGGRSMWAGARRRQAPDSEADAAARS